MDSERIRALEGLVKKMQIKLNLESERINDSEKIIEEMQIILNRELNIG